MRFPNPFPMPARVSLRDIAGRAGVHFSTVSLALKNSPRLSEGTRKRIQAIAIDMGYQHDPWLDALLAYRDTNRRRKHPIVLGYVSSWDAPIESLPHHRFFWFGAKRRADELGFKLEHFSLAEPGMKAARLERILKARGIDGIILSSFSEGAARLEFDWSWLAAVRIELQPAWPPLSTVSVDHLRAVQVAVRRILTLGYRRPGLVLGHNWSELVEDHWLMGFLWAQQWLKPGDRLPALLIRRDNGIDKARAAFESWMSRYAPDVLLGPHAQIEERLASGNRRIPRDIAVADPFLEEPHSFYAGITHSLEAVGAKALELLVGMLTQNVRGIPKEMTRTYVDGRWNDGPSCPPVGRQAAAGPRPKGASCA
jgi:LacI family transcriptional regulator